MENSPWQRHPLKGERGWRQSNRLETLLALSGEQHSITAGRNHVQKYLWELLWLPANLEWIRFDEVGG
jgi:hypothetical protein